jgi:hypothetical protein
MARRLVFGARAVTISSGKSGVSVQMEWYCHLYVYNRQTSGACQQKRGRWRSGKLFGYQWLVTSADGCFTTGIKKADTDILPAHFGSALLVTSMKRKVC